MDKNTIIGFVLIGLVLFGFSWLNRPTPEQIEAQRRYQDSIARIEQIKQNELAQQNADPMEALAGLPDSVRMARLQTNFGSFASKMSGTEEFVTLENEKVSVVLSTKGGRVVLPNYGGFDSLNPFIFKGNAVQEAAALTLDTLGVISIDDYSTVYPLIARQFELPEDRSFVGFVLDERAKFSDGSPVTADDVIFSFNAVMEKGAPIYRVYYNDVERVEKINDRHVRFFFKKNSQNKELPLILAQLSIFSAKDWTGKDFSKPTLSPYLGSGPYLIEKIVPGKSVIFKRNPNYWAKDLPSRRGFFNFDEVDYEYYQDTTVTLQALFAGSIDMREEYIAKIWVTGYDNKQVRNGTVIKEELPQYGHFQSLADHFIYILPQKLHHEDEKADKKGSDKQQTETLQNKYI